MTFTTRLTKLERITASRPRDCPACGNPSRAVIAVVVTDHSDPLPKCHNCGITLTENGLPIIGPFRRVILEPDKHEPQAAH